MCFDNVDTNGVRPKRFEKEHDDDDSGDDDDGMTDRWSACDNWKRYRKHQNNNKAFNNITDLFDRFFFCIRQKKTFDSLEIV